MDRLRAIRPPAFFVAILIFGCVNGEIQQRAAKQLVDEPTVTKDKESIFTKECNKSYSLTCLKLDAISFVEKLSETPNIGILPGVSVIKENVSNDMSTPEVVANLARDFPNDINKRLDAYLMHKVGNYLSSHSISIKLFDSKTLEDARSLSESGFGLFKKSDAETGRKKDKGGMSGLAAGLMMMKGTLGALGFGALAMLAGKALMTGLMALMLSAIVGLKSLASGGEKKTTYEVIAKPVYTSSHSHSSEDHHGHGYGGSGYGRSIDIPEALIQESISKYANVRGPRNL
ncbi:uncharacterized protein [Chelonus insularis]|uniref:uncharacterized protein n=1 Tax=Chelonus insularis TaxID=460826 RepID=UPI00158B07F0|nr:uncharacterized protein LOC118073414 [Chelonus insularis]